MWSLEVFNLLSLVVYVVAVTAFSARASGRTDY